MDKEKYNKAFKEVYMILKSFGKEMQGKIPTSLLDFIEENMDKDYFFILDDNIPLEEQSFMDETLGIISLIYRDYLCTDEEREKIKKEDEIYFKEIQTQREKELREKYNPDNIFKKNSPTQDIIQDNISSEVISDNVAMVEYKESVFKKIINNIKSIFHMH